MRIVCLFADRMGPQQDLLLDCTILGLARAFGSTCVTDLFRKPQYRNEDPEFQREWPFNVASHCFYGKPEWNRPYRVAQDHDDIAWQLKEADAIVLNIRFLQHAVPEGVCDEISFEYICDQIDPAKTILIDSSDSPQDWRGKVPLRNGAQPRLFCCRPGADCDFPLWIQVPQEHLWRVWASFDRSSCYANIDVFAAWNDNGSVRRQLMRRLVERAKDADIDHPWSLCWGSASGHTMPRTFRLPNPASYYQDMSLAKVCVSAAGANVDCLRRSEILCLGRCLVTDNFGCTDFRHREHCLYFNDADDMIEQIEWALSYPDDAERIARTGQKLWLEKYTPEQQSFRMIQAAGLLR